MCPAAVVPWVHSGMEAVIPAGSKLPRPGADVRLLVGEPVDVSDLLEAARRLGWPEQRLYAAIAARVGGALHALKARLEGLPLSEVRAPSLGHPCAALPSNAVVIGRRHAEHMRQACMHTLTSLRQECCAGPRGWHPVIITSRMRQVVRERALAGGAASEEALLPLLEQEMDALAHPMAQPSMRQSAGLTPTSSRAQQRLRSSSGALPQQPRCEGPLQPSGGPLSSQQKGLQDVHVTRQSGKCMA